ncbi:hypothetical protein IG631_18922 [Alternaria alternata]|nr:hypothetical protein IG631_18922 [Alternaria alternata]
MVIKSLAGCPLQASRTLTPKGRPLSETAVLGLPRQVQMANQRYGSPGGLITLRLP